MAAPSSAPVSHLWYVQASGQVWGPYAEARVAAFVAEGRLSAATPVSPWSEGPFTVAGHTPEFAALLRPAPSRARPDQARPPAAPPEIPAPEILSPGLSAPEAAASEVFAPEPVGPVRQAGGAARPLLVWA
ncbi:MAG: hypothetical protein WA840_06585, partial [Caulobacteraceae bacterium]